MARQALQMIQCGYLQAGQLVVYLASGANGALRTGLGLDETPDPAGHFRRYFPKAELLVGREWNRPLAAAVEAALEGRPIPANLRMNTPVTPFQRQVLEAAAATPFGATTTYGDVAAALGKPRAARAVGQALKYNPFPLIFP